MPILVKREIDEIRIAILLICNKNTSLRLKVSKLGMIGRYCNLPDYGLVYFETWLRKSTDLIMLHKYDSWKMYLKTILTFIEEYEAILELRLNKII